MGTKEHRFWKPVPPSVRILGIAGAYACAAVLAVALCRTPADSGGRPPAVKKTSVTLKQDSLDEVRLFTEACGQCHAVPDPAAGKGGQRDCTKGLIGADLAAVQKYMVDARAGKELCEDRCGRCHDIIEPSSHTADYWSKNLCSSEECFIKKLTRDEEQQVLLYLSSHAAKQ